MCIHGFVCTFWSCVNRSWSLCMNCVCVCGNNGIFTINTSLQIDSYRDFHVNTDLRIGETMASWSLFVLTADQESSFTGKAQGLIYTFLLKLESLFRISFRCNGTGALQSRTNQHSKIYKPFTNDKRRRRKASVLTQ